MRLKLERRLDVPKSLYYILPAVSIVLALGFGALFLALTGKEPMVVYGIMFKGVFGTRYGMEEALVKTIPLILCGLGVSVAFRMQLWNIGAEGQFILGAIGASSVALYFPKVTEPFSLPLMLIVGFLVGGIWGLIPGVLKAYKGVNESITTLMMNYVATYGLSWLVYGPWKDPHYYNNPFSPVFPQSAQLPTFLGSRVHMGLIIALIAAAVLYVVLWRTKWGYEIRVIGESQGAARYAGMNVVKNIMLVMFVSGGLAGLAGMSEVSGVIHRLQLQISPGYGYSAIIVAWLARLNPWTILLFSFLIGALLQSGYAAQMAGVPAAVSFMLQGAILFFILASDFFTRYKVGFSNNAKKPSTPNINNVHLEAN